VLVRVAASAVNPTDWKTRAGLTPRPIDGFQIPHQDGAGIIDEVGEGVDPARRGQRVWVWFAAAGSRWGTAAEWTVVPKRQAVPLPDGVSMELGAMLGVPAMTAHWCVFADGPVGGKTVLVAGGAGAVGHFAIELAARAGAQVIATASSPEKAALARAAGAAAVADYKDPGAADQIRAAAGPVDRVIEVDLGANLGLDLAVLRRGGTIVTYAAPAEDPALPVRACMTANVVIRFVLLYWVPAAGLGQAVAGISAALAEGALSPLPVRRFSLPEIAAAHEAAEAGPLGKVLVLPSAG
jgi:NADPH2:quinone reductase